MTFESMIDNNNNENAATIAPTQVPVVNESLSVKVSYGNDLRRATYVGHGYAPLRDACVKLFELDPATTVLKYQDEDGDKITMSSDGEVQEAVRLAKDKALRVFLEAKTPAIPPVQEEAPSTFPCGRPSFDWRGPRGGYHGGFGQHRGGFGGFGGFHAGPHSGHGPHRGGFYPGAHPHPPFVGGHHGGFAHHPLPHPHPFSPVETTTTVEQPQPGGPSVNYSSPRTFGHGVFSPADAMSHCKNVRADTGPYARSAWKEHKSVMKEHIKFLKQNAVTEEDRQAIKAVKQQMREDCKAMWKDLKAEKKAEKWERKSEKKDKKCDKKDKKWKCDKKDKKERFIARHVADVTIPDNSELPADTPVTKTWRLRNDGLTAWPADSQLIFISKRGDDLNGPERVPVGSIEPQEEAEVSVTFVTPSEPGRYIGYYRMATAEGAKFGQRVWVSFIITAPAQAKVPASPIAPRVPASPSAPRVPASPVAPHAAPHAPALPGSVPAMLVPVLPPAFVAHAPTATDPLDVNMD